MNRCTFFGFMRRAAYRAAVLAAALALLAGCGVLGLNAPEPVEIRFTYIDEGVDYPSLVEIFQREHPNINVVLDTVPAGGQAVGDLTSRAVDADAVRAFPNEDVSRISMVLDGMVSTDEHFARDDFFAGSLETLTIDGKLVGLPAGLDPFVVFYLPEKFAAAGVPVPGPDWTLEEFVTTAMAIHNTDEAVINTERYTYGLCTHPQMPDLALFTYLYGGGIFGDDILNANPTLNLPENVEAVAWYASLSNDFGLMPKGDISRGLGPMLYRRSCGFWVDFMVESLFGNDMPLDDAQMLPLPTYNARFNIATQQAYFITASSEHPEEAYQWIRFLMGEQSAAGAMIPPLRSIIASETYALTAPAPVAAVARSLPPETVIIGLETTDDQRFSRAMQLFARATERVIEDGIDPQMALDEAQMELEQETD